MGVQLVYAIQAGKGCFRGYVVRSLYCPGLWQNGDTRCSLHHIDTAKAWEQDEGANAQRPYRPGHTTSSYDTNFSHEFIGRLCRFPCAEVQRFYFRHGVWVQFKMGQKGAAAMCTRGSLPRFVETGVRLQGATVCTRGCLVMREIPNPYTRSLALLFGQINSFGGTHLISRVG